MSLALAPEVTAAETSNGLVLLDQRSGRYWQLNGTGATTVRMLLDGRTPDGVAAALRERFPACGERVEADVNSLVGALLDARLVESCQPE
ncbi:lasso peptide biosynthesis PqqD family chaperone [Micromonospora foliorum]|uniref:lasso peptide biosynthesis PqqD family chaperone n=1 Tax=Micromonospora foliorum TaxID=2911210 RepID=UPI001EE9AE91|nr:lasso peptide biosynthesis PqqD family chaperone [Micromonospora foliorum]MCG5435255.1 lasso peptide biosynthesis PqqD family chaperone [Micromonospora foliorum]